MLSPRGKGKTAVVGVGGAGLNTVTRLIGKGAVRCTTIVISDDSFHLSIPRADHKILLRNRTPTEPIGRLDLLAAAAMVEESEDDITDAVAGHDMVFSVCGLGGMIGGGATPAVLRLAKSLRAYTVAFCIWPFAGQGEFRLDLAERGLRMIRCAANMTIIVPNDQLLDIKPMPSINEGFGAVDDLAVSVLESLARATV